MQVLRLWPDSCSSLTADGCPMPARIISATVSFLGTEVVPARSSPAAAISFRIKLNVLPWPGHLPRYLPRLSPFPASGTNLSSTPQTLCIFCSLCLTCPSPESYFWSLLTPRVRPASSSHITRICSSSPPGDLPSLCLVLCSSHCHLTLCILTVPLSCVQTLQRKGAVLHSAPSWQSSAMAMSRHPANKS